MVRECSICYRPMKYNFAKVCSYCSYKIKRDGFHHYRIRLGEVGSATINYQQHLHRKFFGCNAPVKYRGIKENRVYNSVEPSSIILLTKNLKKELDNYLPNNLAWLFNDLNNNIPTFTKRILYNSVLYFIHCHIEEPSKYHDEEHFKSSLLNSVFNHITKTYVRVNREEYRTNETMKARIKLAINEKKHIGFKTREYIYNILCEVCGEIVSSI